MQEDKKGAAVRFPPPLIFLIAMGLGFTLNYYYPQPLMPLNEYARFGALAMFTIGGALAISAVLALHFAKTSVEPWKPTSCIVDTGVFGYSRNPIYLSFVCIGISAALYTNVLWVLLALMPATLVLLIFVIAKEEQYLLEKFGDQYADYCLRVRRWL